MADLSLDDFIKKSNVQGRVGKLQKGTGNINFQRKPVVSNQKNGNRQPSKNFDARQKLGPKTVLDARDKIIINKKSGKGDARNKIVQKQVQKGTFDARSLLQRQAKTAKRKGGSGNPVVAAATPAGMPLTRTLANPSATSRSQIQVTNNGLQVTRPVPSTHVSVTGNSLQVTRRTRPFEGGTPSVASAVPIIQIRNDRYRQPAEQRAGQSAYHYSQPVNKQSSYQAYDPSEYSYPEPAYQSQRGYRDLDDPLVNSASIATIPKIHVPNVRPIEAAGMRPVSYSADYSHIRAPPGAATLSQGAKPPVAKPVLQPAKFSQVGLKRRQPQQDISGPLRLGKGGGPGIDLGPGDPSPSKKSKMAAMGGDIEVIDLDGSAELISPLQGFRVVVTNLFSGVTQDDIIELFGAVGPLKKAKLLKPGTAEVVYVSKDDAVNAVQKYHSRELDGQPMYVKMTTPVAAQVKKAVGDNDPDITGEALRLYKKGSGIGSLPEAAIETPTILRALFKAGPPGPNKSVKFTVKI